MQYRRTKDGLIINIVNRGGEYQADAKEYVVNMCSGKKMLHIKNKCYYAKGMSEYISFDTMKEVKALPIEVSKCQYCFPDQKGN